MIKKSVGLFGLSLGIFGFGVGLAAAYHFNNPSIVGMLAIIFGALLWLVAFFKYKKEIYKK